MTYSFHYVFCENSNYKDLSVIFSDVLNVLFFYNNQKTEQNFFQILLKKNLLDLKKNKKSEGFNRKTKIRLIFPIDQEEFYIKLYSKNADLESLNREIIIILRKSNFNFLVFSNESIIKEKNKK